MSKIFNIFFMLFSLLILFSCEPGRAENGDLLFGLSGSGVTSVSKKLKSVTVDDGTDVVTYSYIYYNDGRLRQLTSSDNSSKYELFYDATNNINKVAVEENRNNVTTTTSFEIVYENGKFKEAKGNGSESTGSKFTNTYKVVYTNNKVSKITSKMVGIDSADPMVTYDMYTVTSDLAYSGNNISTWKYALVLSPNTLPTIELNSTFSDYDNHINPFKLLPEAFNIITSHFETGSYAVTGFSANNYRKINVVSNADNQTANYTYTYDANGYPTKATSPSLGTLTFQYQ